MNGLGKQMEHLSEQARIALDVTGPKIAAAFAEFQRRLKR